MEPEQAAQDVVDTMQAAPVAGAGNEKEREKSVLLDRMDGNEEIGDILVVEEELAEEEVEAEGSTAGAEDEVQQTEVRKQARESVAREFPEALAEGSELYEACQEELAYLREAQSPLADDPLAEYKIARRMARVLGLSRRAPVAEPPAAPAKSAPRRKVRPMPAGNAPVESPATTLERRVSGAKSTGEMLELMREIGTPFEALLKR